MKYRRWNDGEGYLKRQSNDDKVGSQSMATQQFSRCCDTTSQGLEEKGYTVINHEHFCQPREANDRVFGTIDGSDDPSESHMKDCCKEGGSDKDK